MNALPFVVAAYSITIAGIAGLVGWSWSEMRRAESKAKDLNK